MLKLKKIVLIKNDFVKNILTLNKIWFNFFLLYFSYVKDFLSIFNILNLFVNGQNWEFYYKIYVTANIIYKNITNIYERKRTCMYTSANWFSHTNLILCEMAFDSEAINCKRDYEKEVTVCLKVAGYQCGEK